MYFHSSIGTGASRRSRAGFVLLDSPLVVYREPDSEDDKSRYDVKDAFDNSVAASYQIHQVILLENEDPPQYLEDAKIVKFTRSETGRRGFIPSP